MGTQHLTGVYTVSVHGLAHAAVYVASVITLHLRKEATCDLSHPVVTRTSPSRLTDLGVGVTEWIDQHDRNRDNQQLPLRSLRLVPAIDFQKSNAHHHLNTHFSSTCKKKNSQADL